MNSKKQQMIEEGAREHLEEGESVLSSFIAQARGTTQAGMGGVNLIAGELGARKVRRQTGAAEDAGVEIGHGPLAFVVTERRLVTLQLGGMRQKVTGLVGAIPVEDVDSLEVKRLGLAQKIVLTVKGAEIKLEGQSNSDVKEAAGALERAKSSL